MAIVTERYIQKYTDGHVVTIGFSYCSLFHDYGVVRLMVLSRTLAVWPLQGCTFLNKWSVGPVIPMRSLREGTLADIRKSRLLRCGFFEHQGYEQVCDTA